MIVAVVYVNVWIGMWLKKCVPPAHSRPPPMTGRRMGRKNKFVFCSHVWPGVPKLKTVASIDLRIRNVIWATQEQSRCFCLIEKLWSLVNFSHLRDARCHIRRPTKATYKIAERLHIVAVKKFPICDQCPNWKIFEVDGNVPSKQYKYM